MVATTDNTTVIRVKWDGMTKDTYVPIMNVGLCPAMLEENGHIHESVSKTSGTVTEIELDEEYVHFRFSKLLLELGLREGKELDTFFKKVKTYHLGQAEREYNKKLSTIAKDMMALHGGTEEEWIERLKQMAK